MAPSIRRTLLLAAVVALHFQLSSQQTCGNLDVKGWGAKGDGVADDSAAFTALENVQNTGTIYIPPGTYRIGQSITLKKPVIGAQGSIFKVDAGVTLTIANQPEHPYTTFFTGAGNVQFGKGTQFIFAEWWGAAQGPGVTDDATAIEKAYTAARNSESTPMLYLRGVTYGLGRELRLLPAATIVSEESSKIVSVNGNSKGITFTPGNWGGKQVIPNMEGFSEYCFDLEGVSLASVHFKTLTNCGDAIRFSNAADQQGVMVNTVWFDKIVNAAAAITFRFPFYGIVQGNHVVGNLIQGGPASGEAYSILLKSSMPNNGHPAWDSNNFDILRIEPPNNANWRMFRAQPRCDKEHIKIGSVAALVPGQKLFNPEPYNDVTKSWPENNIMFATVKLDAPLPEGGWGPLVGQLCIYDVSGATTPAKATTPVIIRERSNSQATFNGGKALVGNYHTLLAVPDQDWAPGTMKTFYFYHQFANGFTYQLKCNAPKDIIECLRMTDNHLPGFGTGSAGELVLDLINNSGGTVKGGTGAIFTISLFTMGAPN